MYRLKETGESEAEIRVMDESCNLKHHFVYSLRLKDLFFNLFVISRSAELLDRGF